MAASRLWHPPAWIVPLIIGASVLAFGVVFSLTGSVARAFVLVPLGAIAAYAGVRLFRADPAWSFTAALCASIFAGNWPAMGIPGPLSLERPLFLLGLVTLMRQRCAARAAGQTVQRLELKPVHLAMAAALVFVVGSALWAGTYDDRGSVLRIGDRFGVVPFVMFAVAPFVFRTAYQRSILMWALVGLGGYLGLTALLESIAPAVVLPRYIVDPNYGYQPNRARGPFAESVTMGMALWTCIVASVLAIRHSGTQRLRLLAASVALLCAAGIVLTLTRSVWVGSVLSVLVVLVAAPELRRYFLPLALAGALALSAAFVAFPALSSSVDKRTTSQRSIWDRQNAASAAFGMVRERPLTGFGWNTFLDHAAEYQRQAESYPLTNADIIVHNAILLHLAEIGLVGTSLWLLAMGLAVAAALFTRGPPELRAWRLAVWALAPFWLVIATFVYPQVFPNLALMAFAGVAAGAEMTSPQPAVVRAPVPARPDLGLTMRPR